MDHTELHALSERQKQDPDALDALEAVVVSFARWRGMTDEDPAKRDAAKELLDRSLDNLEPDDGINLRNFTKTLGAENMRELLAYTFRHAFNDLKDKAREIERLPDLNVESTADDEASNSKNRTRERRRERER